MYFSFFTVCAFKTLTHFVIVFFTPLSDEATFYDQNQTYARALLQWSRAANQGNIFN